MNHFQNQLAPARWLILPGASLPAYSFGVLGGEVADVEHGPEQFGFRQDGLRFAITSAAEK